jgi:hypothetical protein
MSKLNITDVGNQRSNTKGKKCQAMSLQVTQLFLEMQLRHNLGDTYYYD